MAHYAFVFVVVRRADAAQHVFGVHFPRVIDEVAVVEVGDGEAVGGRGRAAKEGEAFFHGERVSFRGIVTDRDDEPVEHFHSLLDHPEMSIGGRVERACVNSGAHGRNAKAAGNPGKAANAEEFPALPDLKHEFPCREFSSEDTVCGPQVLG